MKQGNGNERRFFFTVDDNIRVLRELTETTPESMLDHPYLAMYRRMHEIYGVKVQLNLFYEEGDFDLSRVSDRYRDEWEANAHWLKLSFHSKLEDKFKPYEFSGYDEVYTDCANVHREILRFSSPVSLAKTTTLHYCRATEEGLRAMRDNGVVGLLGLYGTDGNPRTSYQNSMSDAEKLRHGEIVTDGGIAYAGIDLILNNCKLTEIQEKLTPLMGRPTVKLMTHEQYFYLDYRAYQSDFEEKLKKAFAFLLENGYVGAFFEDCI